jgi:glycosyltransferase involved in cell wall biosynthesis
MKILLVSTTDIYGGAAIATNRTFDGLRKLNLNVNYFVQYKFSKGNSLIIKSKFNFIGYLKTGLDIFLSKFAKDVWSSSFFFSPNVNQILKLNPDVINLNWINNMLTVKEIEKIVNKNIIVTWTLHDMWALQGGYHYKFEKHTGIIFRYLDNFLYKKKKKIYSRIEKKIHIITPSNWLANEVKKSELMKNFNVTVIPYGLDTNVFYPIKNAKQKLSLNENTKYILFGAISSLNDKRKGVDLLLDALKFIPLEYEILIFGNNNTKIKLKHKVRFFGTIKEPSKLATIYSAADIFVAPSRQDNLPNTVLEAMSCGTPVVAFNIGGMPDMIDFNTGALAKPFDTADFSKKIIEVSHNSKLGTNAREKIVKNFTLEKNALSHLSLYEKLLNRQNIL